MLSLPFPIPVGRDFFSHLTKVPHPSNPPCPLLLRFLQCILTALFRLIYRHKMSQIAPKSFCSIQAVNTLPTFHSWTWLPLEIKAKALTFENSSFTRLSPTKAHFVLAQLSPASNMLIPTKFHLLILTGLAEIILESQLCQTWPLAILHGIFWHIPTASYHFQPPCWLNLV